MTDLSAVELAAKRIAGRVRRTPVLDVEPALLGAALTLKLELLQHTASFKPRGAFNRVLSARVPAAGIIAASGGNHGLAVAHVARELGIPAEIFVPHTTPDLKVRRLRTLGAAVTVTGEFYADAYDASQTRAAVTGALPVHAYDHPDVVAGQGTVGLELLDQIPDLDTVLVAVGGGGLIAGIATVLDHRARVVAVEPERAATLHAALAGGEPVDVPVGGLAADSLGARRIGTICFEVATAQGVTSLLVTDEDIRGARRTLWDSLRIAAEPGGATAFAALQSGAYVPAAGERVAVLVCGGNSDPATLTSPPHVPTTDA